jgi:hypothetical protein
MAKSLIERLPAGMRSRALQRLSRNARGPGGISVPKAYGGGAIGRGASAWQGSGAGARGVIPIEVRPGTLTADIAVILPPGVATVTLDHGGADATPPTGDHTDKTFATVTYATPGLKTVVVTAPANYYGEVQFTV